MTESQTAILVALIALGGTLGGIVFGYRKWRAQARAERFGAFEKERQAAYKEMWSQVENLNVDSRIDPIDDSAFLQRRQEVNASMLRAGIYVEDRDRELINEYMAAVREFHKAVRRSGREDAETDLGNTGDIPPEVLVTAREIAETQERALDLREAVITRVQEVVAGAAIKKGPSS